ncbi:MAG: DEAD/DEAH box helicase [Candidatus Margulisiibacteriota bacterium]|jgi:ATP-dependent RNA helicase RhlE
METNSKPSFSDLGLSKPILDLLAKMKFTTPTPIQNKAIPMALSGKDVVGIAQTGTGKTLAFGLPMIQILSQGNGMGLILVPTRELAMQVEEALAPIARAFQIRTAVIIGGASMHHQIQAIKRNPRIIVATPGRLIDHLEQRTIMLFDVKLLVLDEADRMLDMGFAPQIKRVLQTVPAKRQTMLFSATMPGDIVQIATKHMQLPINIEVTPPGTTADNVTQELFIVSKSNKKVLLEKVLQKYTGTVLLFTRTKYEAKNLNRHLQMAGHKSAEIHSNRSLGQRKEALEGFKSGYYRILIATDIASRGIDVNNIELVINYDLPDEAGNYIHRIGRTARAGREGHAISFATPDQGLNIRDIERLIRTEIEVSRHPEILAEQFYNTRGTGPGAPRSTKTFKPRSQFKSRSTYGRR